MKLNVEVLELEKDDIVCILSGFSVYGGYWATLSWDDNEYSEAKEIERSLLDEGDNVVCFEDILANMLLNGKKIIISDSEEDDYEDQELTLEKLIKGLNLSIQENRLSLDSADWDAEDCDVIVQNALFNEVVYG